MLRLKLPRTHTLRGFGEKANGRIEISNISDKNCRWPLGDVGAADFHFCGTSPHDGLPYCKDHAKMAYRRYQPERPQP